jgi:hypothetical protein
LTLHKRKTRPLTPWMPKIRPLTLHKRKTRPLTLCIPKIRIFYLKRENAVCTHKILQK